MSLISNPLGELLGPVSRLEASVDDLGERISGVEALPQIQEELAATREATEEMLAAVRAIHGDLTELSAVLQRALDAGSRIPT